MDMDTIFATLAYCLLAISFTVAQTEKGNFTITPTTTPDTNMTLVTSSDSTINTTVFSIVPENTSPYTSTDQDSETTNKTTSHTQPSPSTTIVTPHTNSTSQITTPGSHTPALTALTTPAIQTATGHKSTPGTTVLTTAYSSHTVNTTTDSKDRTTQGLGLNLPERSMTIIFSVTLAVFAVVLVVLMFHRYKHQIQYLHQPLNNTGDTDAFVADEDTLVISGGLYDGHPIYDNVPTAPEDQPQLRLQFLH